uniref:Caspase family p20 domain-containing protein n=1 Tax=Setaria digitata TaxID=48799 RepID=A0A915Q0Q2_9BILA
MAAAASYCSIQLKSYELSTNLAELPSDLHWRLANSLNFQTLWIKIIDDSTKSAFNLSVSEYDRISQAKNQGSSILYLWGNRGQTVKHLLQRLQSFSKMHGACMDGPQLALRRKFVPVKWSAEEQITVKVMGIDECMLQLLCHARGFPWPRFQWMENNKDVNYSKGKALVISRIWNEIEEGFEYSTFYRKTGKAFHSELITNGVELSAFIPADMRVDSCERCAKYENSPLPFSIDYLRNTIFGNSIVGWNAELIATDKVALIISNCDYINLPSLVTPHCDAEMLAESLQNLNFKTVALGDLNLVEMYFFIKEYRRLLGDGVYGEIFMLVISLAVFYFVGHGFERNGKNYLLAVDAPGADSKIAGCVSVEWILSVFEDSHPALNLILLDVCRKNMKCLNTTGCLDAADTEVTPKIARNTVCGYATSSGVSAFEVHGEKNGVFMKHLLQHIADEVTVLEMLTKTFQEIANDPKVRDAQIPELKSNLVLPRGLRDPLVCYGHTASFSCHTLHWRYMHELPDPITVQFEDQNMIVTIWYDYVGHFTNKVYILSSVSDLPRENKDETYCLKPMSTKFSYVAHLRFPEHFDVSPERVIEDGDEGVSISVMLSNLQRLKGAISCSIDLSNREDNRVIASKSNIPLGDVLVTRIYRMEYNNSDFNYGGNKNLSVVDM